jgi:hypothetical protein
VKADERLPVLVAGALYRLADILPSERHLRGSGAVPNVSAGGEQRPGPD